jgi:methylenetetrahydrofolate--tRNA-(uracil-5-)-methyltransferase
MIGALCHYVTHAPLKDFQPMKANYGILQPLEGATRQVKRERARAYADRSLAELELQLAATAA